MTRPSPSRACSPGSSRPPTPSTWATTSARSGSGWPCRRTTTRSTSSSTCTRSPSSTTRRRCAPHPPAAAQLLALGLDPARCTLFVQSHVPEHAAAGLGAGLPHRVRRGRPDDPVQGQGRPAAGRPRVGRAVHLPDPAGRRHPALPGRPGAGRRGPAPAPGADPRPRAAFQHPLRADVHGARALHPRGRREDLRPAGPDGEDEQVRLRRRPGSSTCSTTRRSARRRSGRRSPTPSGRSATTRSASRASPTC